MNLKAVQFDGNNNKKYPSLSTNIISEKKSDVDNYKTNLFVTMFKINNISIYSNYNGDDAPSYIKKYQQYLLMRMVDSYYAYSYRKKQLYSGFPHSYKYCIK